MRDSIYNSKECMERAMYDLMKMENEFARLNIEYGCHKVKEIMKSTCCTVFEVEDYIKQEQLFQANLDKIESMIKNGILIEQKELRCGLSDKTLSAHFLFNQGTYLCMDEYMSDNSSPQLSKYQDSITQLKSQLKHCKNHMQRLNIERELNKLYKEKR